MTMTTTEVAQATAKPILEIGRAWMMAPGTAERSAELGLAESGRFGFWVNGRAGVLGDVDSQVAAAAIGFMEPASVAHHWHARPNTLSAWDAAVAWFDCGAVWGRSAFADMSGADVQQLSNLTRKVIDSADPSFGSLFAGSVGIPLPGDAAGDAIINLNVLRELRGGAHLSASHAAGLGPHATIMSTDDPIRGGAQWAEGFGWAAPHPAGDAAARVEVEKMTTAASARAFESLSGEERSEFANLVAQARRQLD